MPQPISLERFAELTARITFGQKRDEVLEAAHLDLDTWDTSQQYWLGKMATEAGRNRFSLAQRYAVLFKAAQAQITGIPIKVPRYPLKKKAEPPRVVVHAMPVAPPVSSSQLPPPPPSVPAPVSSPMSSPMSAPPASLPAVVPPPPSMGALPPPPSSARVYTARLTLEQLAAMRAEIALAPEGEQGNVMQRFGLDAATWEQEETHWQRRLAGDQELFKRYLRQFQYCRSLLQRA